ncbi:hypothetical protein CBM2589_A70487 [Cupriavidus taiwanensis]|uniref:Uncharacterized protein n=1 Tax=Cupriavidus taiwanensis TaxID=164546 RepID=A0A976A6M7_9BURK|nr:hypothetical protein CBM2589_A70487 [Cupriavidus taiwanensis]
MPFIAYNCNYMLRPMSRTMPQPARFACGHFFLCWRRINCRDLTGVFPGHRRIIMTKL